MPEIAPTPTKRAGFRDPDHVMSVVLRMGDSYVEALDKLCEINKRSRRELVEILVADAWYELEEDPNARLTP